MSPEHEIHTLLILKTAKEAEINAKLSLISLKSDLNLEKLNLLKFIILLNQDDKYFVAVQDTVALMRVNSFTTLLLSTYTSTSDYSFKRDILLLLFLIYYSTPSDSPVDIIKTIFNYDSLSSHSPLDISLIQEIVHISSLLSLELLNLDGVPIKLDINSILSVLDDSNHEYKSLFYAGLSCWLESQVDGDFDGTFY